ncbi:hypothetical protein AAFF_G00352610 [Aldrovandia affinis]|uniref:Uncharacterized protein n=1 Tax=Aldrovandia affinis TaxID=143900 RepID=A0AAD7SIZ1_9TELE|nr:hypothetical protein AAFF_G00352610 [Aldrovandia affinis]
MMTMDGVPCLAVLSHAGAQHGRAQHSPPSCGFRSSQPPPLFMRARSPQPDTCAARRLTSGSRVRSRVADAPRFICAFISRTEGKM